MKHAEATEKEARKKKLATREFKQVRHTTFAERRARIHLILAKKSNQNIQVLIFYLHEKEGQTHSDSDPPRLGELRLRERTIIGKLNLEWGVADTVSSPPF